MYMTMIIELVTLYNRREDDDDEVTGPSPEILAVSPSCQPAPS